MEDQEKYMPGEKTVLKKKTTTRRNRQERIEYAASRKKGKRIELLRPITQCTPADLGFTDCDTPVQINEIAALTIADLCDRLNIAPDQLMFKLVDHTEGMCDLNDVKQVMMEGDIINGVIPVRMDDMIERVPTKTYTFK